MQNPTVSFIVPCYKLAHLLPECINSILAQTFTDFEVLIMDDCSPDNTAEVANSFNDPRIKYIRNDPNLGALRNYNKGISLGSGKYAWLISADDYLRKPYILQRYVDILNAHPSVGYVFCPGVGVRNGQEIGLLSYSEYGKEDQVVNGNEFIKNLIHYNIILSASALVRKECYEKLSYFPLDVVWAGIPVDMIWGGDWYLWLLFALHYDVGYFAEPMVCYREHDLSMTNTVTQDKNENCWAAEIAVLWMIKKQAVESGLEQTAKICTSSIATQYAKHCSSKQYQWLDRSSSSSISIDKFEESLCLSTENENERNQIRALAYEGMGDSLVYQGHGFEARKYYFSSLKKQPWKPKVYVKILLSWLGKYGDYIHRLIGSVINRNLPR